MTNSSYIQSLLIRLCRQPRTFEFISRRMNGLDPIKVKEALNDLVELGKLVKRGDMWLVPVDISNKIPSKNSQLYLKKHMGYFEFLKLPHPLDFEWRNSTESLNYLITQVQSINTIDDNILFLGMPTLFATACLKDIPQRVTLVEKNKPIIKGLAKLNLDKERFKIVEADIFEVSPEEIGRYHCVIMDPPWYSPHFYQFMWLASQCVDVGGVIGISIPPINTRPGIEKERIDWFSFCQSQGLCIESLSPEKLHYAMPFFEFNAFRAEGVSDIVPFWRKGDLAFFRKVQLETVDRPAIIKKKNHWKEVEISSVRFRINVEIMDENSDLQITSLIKGDILPTVSTRDKRREGANVWTSGNRIFKVNKPNTLLKCLLKIKKKENLISADETTTKEFVNTITTFEKEEHNNYLDWLYHEMERQTA